MLMCDPEAKEESDPNTYLFVFSISTHQNVDYLISDHSGIDLGDP